MTSRRPPFTHDAHKGLFMLCITTCLMLGTNTLMHQLSQKYSAAQMIFFKGSFGFMSVLILWKDAWGALCATTHWQWHLLRAVVGVGGNVLWIHALANLLLANATALSLTSAFWSMLGAWMILGERFSLLRLVSGGVAFLGALFIVKPGTQFFHPPVLYPLGSSLCFAVSELILRYTGQKDDVRVSVGVLTLVMMIWGGSFSYACWVPPNTRDWIWLIGIGIGYGVGQLFLAKAYALAEASYLAPFKMIRYPIMVGVGVMFFHEYPDIWSMFGGICILIALAILWQREMRTHR